LLGVAAPVALMIMLWVMAQISRRFGEVTHRPPIYRGFYVSIGLLVFPLVVRVLAVGLTEENRADLGGNSIGALVHDLPLIAAITLALIVAWRYWGWLIYAREGESPVPPARKR
jgi:chromate transport protein ChrA